MRQYDQFEQSSPEADPFYLTGAAPSPGGQSNEDP